MFPKDTIVLDNYLKQPSQFNRKRFTLAHELGHIIKNRMINGKDARYHYVGTVMIADKKAAHAKLHDSGQIKTHRGTLRTPGTRSRHN